MSVANISVRMIRDSLADLPDFPVPQPYSIRWYQPGDEAAWIAIHVATDPFNDIQPTLFRREFGEDETMLAQRQAYLCDGQGQPVGTASAWPNEPSKGPEYGRVHWVAILPTHQGQGLAKPLLAVVCRRLRQSGHTRAYLDTSTGRLPALNLYLKFGFVPEIRHDQDVTAWREVGQHLDHPALSGI